MERAASDLLAEVRVDRPDLLERARGQGAAEDEADEALTTSGLSCTDRNTRFERRALWGSQNPEFIKGTAVAKAAAAVLAVTSSRARA